MTCQSLPSRRYIFCISASEKGREPIRPNTPSWLPDSSTARSRSMPSSTLRQGPLVRLVTISFGVGFSSVSTTPSRFLVGIGTRFRGPTAIGTPSLGVAIPPGASPSFLDDPALSQSMGVSIHSVLFNQVTHAVWRGGLLNGTVTGDALGGSLPEGLTADLNGRLPPVAEMISGPEGDFVQIGIGALDLALVYPGLFEEPIRVTLGARATTNVALMGNDLSFEDITIPAGSSNIVYQITAVRGKARGPAAQFLVNFGVGGAASVTAIEDGEIKLAA